MGLLCVSGSMTDSQRWEAESIGSAEWSVNDGGYLPPPIPT